MTFVIHLRASHCSHFQMMRWSGGAWNDWQLFGNWMCRQCCTITPLGKQFFDMFQPLKESTRRLVLLIVTPTSTVTAPGYNTSCLKIERERCDPWHWKQAAILHDFCFHVMKLNNQTTNWKYIKGFEAKRRPCEFVRHFDINTKIFDHLPCFMKANCWRSALFLLSNHGRPLSIGAPIEAMVTLGRTCRAIIHMKPFARCFFVWLLTRARPHLQMNVILVTRLCGWLSSSFKILAPNLGTLVNEVNYIYVSHLTNVKMKLASVSEGPELSRNTCEPESAHAGAWKSA